MQKNEDAAALGALLKKVIRKSGNTLEDTASMIGVTFGTLMRWGSGRNMIPAESLDKLCQVLAVDQADRLALLSACHIALISKWRNQ